MRTSQVKFLKNILNGLRTNIKSSLPEVKKEITGILKPQHKDLLTKKISDLNNWYTRLLGLDEVKAFQDRVIALQDQLMNVQEKRREVGKQLAEVRKKSNELQDELHKVKRQEDIQKFLSLMREETEVLRLEHEIQQTFQEYDQAEREIFTAFANAIRDSHEKQRAQLEYTKYFGLILSIIGSFLAFCYTSIKKKDLKHFLENNVNNLGLNSEELKHCLEQYNEKMDTIVNYMNEETVHTINYIKNNTHKLDKILNADEEWKKNPNIVQDGNTLRLKEGFPSEENKYVKYALYIGLAYFIIRIFSPSY